MAASDFICLLKLKSADGVEIYETVHKRSTNRISAAHPGVLAATACARAPVRRLSYTGPLILQEVLEMKTTKQNHFQMSRTPTTVPMLLVAAASKPYSPT